MADKKGAPVRFSLLTVVVWLLVASTASYLLWQVINRISEQALPVSTPTPNLTQIYETIAAVLTAQPSSVATAEPVDSTPTSTQVPVSATSSLVPSPQYTSISGKPSQTATPHTLCNQAAAGNPIDVTIPDDSLLTPGQSFTKTWKLVNAGTCTWTTAYSASFFYGDSLAAPESVALPEDVLPAHSVEISLEMVAPSTPGTYQGNWKLSDPEGSLFGIGPNGDSPFWVRIIVRESQTSTPTATYGPSPTSTATSETTPTPTPEGQLSGELSATPGDGINFDTLTLNSGADDLLYQADASQYHWLIPLDHAMIGVFGSSQPTEADCESGNMSSAPIAVESLSPGTYFCYLGNNGRYGRMLLVSVDAASYTLTLDMLTWPGLP
jgi:hypothetical protein